MLKVLERDHYQCQMCGSKKHLHVHHIKHFSDILKRILEEHPDYEVMSEELDIWEPYFKPYYEAINSQLPLTLE